MGSQIGHGQRQMPRWDSGYVGCCKALTMAGLGQVGAGALQRQRRGHQIQSTSSPIVQSSSAPTTQPGNQLNSQKGRSSSTKPDTANTRRARNRCSAPGRVER